MNIFVDYTKMLFLLTTIVVMVVRVGASESSILWSLEDTTAARSCIYTITGDPTDWVPKLNIDDEYEVIADPLCVNGSVMRLGPLASNPALPDVVVSSDMIDNSLLYFEATHEGNAKTFFAGAQKVTGIAVDYQSQNVYYTDPDIGLVIVQFAVSRPYFTILLEDLDQPHNVLIDPDRGKLCWAEATVVRCSGLAGEQIMSILTGISTSTVMALDRENQKIIVLDQEMGTLRSMDYDGQNVVYLLDDPDNIDPGMFSGVAVDQGYIFGTLAAEATVIIWKQATGIRQAALSFPVSTAIQHGITTTSIEPTQPTGPCTQDNGGCSQICIHPPSNSRVCKCGFGYAIQADGTSCTAGYLRDKFLLVSDIGSDKLYQIDLTTGDVHAIPIDRTTNQRMEALDYDPETNVVIWIDTGNGTLRSRVLEDGATERIIFTFPEVSVVEGIAYNPSDGYIYYTDYGQSQIGRVSLKDGTQEIILSLNTNDRPVQIRVDAIKGYMYWTNIGEPPTIERAKMTDASVRNVLVHTDIKMPTGLVLDVNNEAVFWSDEVLERIERINMDGSGREMIKSTEALYSVAVDNTYLYAGRQHEVRRYSLKADNPQSTLGLKAYSVLYGMHLYSSELIPTPPDGSGAVANSGYLHHLIIMGVVIFLHEKL